MIRDITIGQYYATESLIHQLDPRVKIMGTLIFIFTLFFVKSIFVFPFIALLMGVIIHISKVPPHFVFKGIKGILIIIIFTVLINIFMTPGEMVIFQYKKLSITGEGLLMAAFIAIRLVMLVIGSSLLTLATSPIQLTDGIEKLLKPYKKIGVPSHEIAMMMSIALRFIPVLLEETDKIMKAQQARGADFETGNILQRAKSMVPILVPLFISAFRRADELALAMEARCYQGDVNRTKMRQMRYTRNDYISMVFIGLYTLAIIMLWFYMR